MFSSNRLFVLGLALAAAAAFPACALAQGASATPSPAPAAAKPTVLDRAYDGATHWSVAPYVWLPTFGGIFSYKVPTLPRAAVGGAASIGVSIPPSQYLNKLNSAAMLDLAVRKGDVQVFADYDYVNIVSSSSRIGNISGPNGRIQIPVDASSSTRLTAAIWEIAAGYTLYHNSYTDLELFGGYQSLPAKTTLDYSLAIGKHDIISNSGTLQESAQIGDVIFGLRGNVLFGNSGWYAPYYIDIGSGYNNQSWQALAGVGYHFPHGQGLLLSWRNLNYDSDPGSSIQKLTMGGPLLGYQMSF